MNAEWLNGPANSLTRFGEVPKFKEGLYRLSGKCYSWMVPNGSWGETNIGLIDCGGKSVLIDTCWDVKFTKEMLKGAADIVTPSPIEYIVNTHADGDHCWGNELFKDKEIIASHACIHQMHHTTPSAMRSLGITCQLLKLLPSAAINKFAHYMYNMTKPYDLKGLSIVVPNSGYSGQKVVEVNGVEIVLTEVGPGHTEGDTIVYVPSEAVVYAADVLFIDATPVAWAGPISNIVDGLKRLLEYKNVTYVPGHGPFATAHSIQLLVDYWEFIQDALHPRQKVGMTPYEAAKDIVQSARFKETPFASWDSPERLVTNAYSLYRQWGAELPSLPGKLGVLNLMRQQANLAFDVPDASPKIMRQRT